MRLDRLTVGSAKSSATHAFKNLKDVTIDFDQDHWVTVVIGWNGTGKSNVMEALAIIFRDLIAGTKTPAFSYRLQYRMGAAAKTRHIHIDADPDRLRDQYVIHFADTETLSLSETTHAQALDGPLGRPVTFSEFVREGWTNLPRYVFSYYSGESPRMRDVFQPYLESYDTKLRSGLDPGPKRLFFALPIHSQFVLLAFLIQQNDAIRRFLVQHLGLDPEEGLESVLFVLRQPPWKSRASDGDERFWRARGIVREFLARLYEIALAPVRVSRRERISLWNDKTLEFLYLYVKDITALRALVRGQAPANFFRDLESTYVSELIDEVRIRVKLSNTSSSLTFRELSEGEQQLLTVLGLLRFTATEESLFLLDEPDTHLNPRWCVDYLTFLRDFAGAEQQSAGTSHIVLATHNPLAIAELVKQQVQILTRSQETGEIAAAQPEIDPRGMGYAGIVTSDMFGLAAALDQHTQGLLERKRRLTVKEEALSALEREDLTQINMELDRYGFRYAMRDPIYEEYLRARYSRDSNAPADRKLSTLPATERRQIAKAIIAKAASKIRAEEEPEDSNASD